MNAQEQMSKSEREDLQRLVRQREKVLKSAAKQRSAELIADFENQMGQQYSFDQDETWAEAHKAADIEVAKAQDRVAARCRELGIPDRFAPSLSLRWYNTGYDNILDKRNVRMRSLCTGGLMIKQVRLGIGIGMPWKREKRQAISISTGSSTPILRKIPAVHQRAKNPMK
jgi:hypothetical protein